MRNLTFIFFIRGVDDRSCRYSPALIILRPRRSMCHEHAASRPSWIFTVLDRSQRVRLHASCGVQSRYFDLGWRTLCGFIQQRNDFRRLNAQSERLRNNNSRSPGLTFLLVDMCSGGEALSHLRTQSLNFLSLSTASPPICLAHVWYWKPKISAKRPMPRKPGIPEREHTTWHSKPLRTRRHTLPRVRLANRRLPPSAQRDHANSRGSSQI